MNEVLALNNFVATSNQWKLVHNQELSVPLNVSKEIVPFQQARNRIPNLGVRCKNASVRLHTKPPCDLDFALPPVKFKPNAIKAVEETFSYCATVSQFPRPAQEQK